MCHLTHEVMYAKHYGDYSEDKSIFKEFEENNEDESEEEEELIETKMLCFNHFEVTHD